MKLYFDMDGTIADTYAVNEWEQKLDRGDTTPYTDATPLVDMTDLVELLSELRSYDIQVNVITWSMMYKGPEMVPAVDAAKKTWIKEMGLDDVIDTIYTTVWGLPKSTFLDPDDVGILFDDNEICRTDWTENNGIAVDPTKENIIEVLEYVLNAVKEG